MIAGLTVLVCGTACLLAAALAWAGWWRSWTQRALPRVGAGPITLLPGLAAAMIAAGCNELGILSASSPVSAVCFAGLAVGLVLSFTTPRWWGPRWYRTGYVDAPLDIGDPATALAVVGGRAIAARRGDAPVHSQAPAAAGPPVRRWRGSWVAGDETGPAAHGLTHAGCVYGHFAMHAGAITFAASQIEDLMREQPTVLTIAASDVRAARVVPAGAGPDGRRREASGVRSVFPRLVLDTPDGSHVFEVQFAARTARQIRAGLDLDAERS